MKGLDDDDTGGGNDQLLLIPKEGRNQSIKCKKKCLSLSQMITTALSDDPQATEIELKQIDEEALKWIVQFLEHQNGIEPVYPTQPLQSANPIEFFADPWHVDFYTSAQVNDIQPLCKLLKAADYMSINALLSLTSAFIISKIKGAPLDTVHRVLSGHVRERNAQPSETSCSTSTSSASSSSSTSSFQ